MNSKKQEARMYQKRDATEAWFQANAFKPGPGELIIYEKDEIVKKPRIKVGDGETALADLPFFAGELYSQSNEPLDASEGAIWINDKEVFNPILTNAGGGNVIAVNITFSGAGTSSDRSYYDIATSLEAGYFVYAIISFVSGDGTKSQRYAVVSSYKANEYIEFTTWGPGIGNSWLQSDNLSTSCKILSNDKIELVFSGGGADWGINTEGAGGYIYNRPIWNQKTDYNFDVTEGEEIESGIFYITDFAPNYFNMNSISITVELNETDFSGASSWPIAGYFASVKDLDEKLAELGNEADKKIYVLNGVSFGYLSDCYVFVDGNKNVLCEIISPNYKKTDDKKVEGIYIRKIQNDSYNRQITKLSFEYQEIQVDQKYSKFFKNKEASNVFTLNLNLNEIMSGDIQYDKIVALLLAELNRFDTGDIILIPAALLEGVSEG